MMHGRATSIHELTRSSQPRLKGSYHFPPYNILYVWPHDLHANVILFRNSKVMSSEIFEIRTLATLEAHNFLCKPSIEVRLKTKLYPSSKAFQ